MFWALAIGIFGGVCMILTLQYFESRKPSEEDALIDSIDITEDF